uniref:Uncharacterized protein n=1 Tax=Anopheles minimus TaxID=112268 RepID=A0A182WPG9_9DIPT
MKVQIVHLYVLSSLKSA